MTDWNKMSMETKIKHWIDNVIAVSKKDLNAEQVQEHIKKGLVGRYCFKTNDGALYDTVIQSAYDKVIYAVYKYNKTPQSDAYRQNLLNALKNWYLVSNNDFKTRVQAVVLSPEKFILKKQK